MNTPLPQPIHGYPRADVDEFLRAAAAERVRLEAEIADANARIAHARSAVGTHRVMVAMLLEAQRQLSELRRDAEIQAERIIAEAEIEAQAIERGVRGSAASRPTFAEPSIDLTRPDLRTEDPAEFFDFLRGALADDRPLGPRAD
jgi:ABC-type transporter Mla subunit MlaD